MKKKIFFLLAVMAILPTFVYGQNVIDAKEYLKSRCLEMEGADSLFIELKPRELRKNSEDILFARTADSLRAKTLRMIGAGDLVGAKKVLMIGQCLTSEGGRKNWSSKKQENFFFNHYLNGVWAYTDAILNKEKVLPEEYIFLYSLQNTGTRADDPTIARGIILRLLELYEKEPGQRNFMGSNDQALKAVQGGILMLVETYERGLNKMFAVKDFEKAVGIFISYVPNEYKEVERRRWKKTIGDRCSIYLP